MIVWDSQSNLILFDSDSGKEITKVKGHYYNITFNKEGDKLLAINNENNQRKTYIFNSKNLEITRTLDNSYIRMQYTPDGGKLLAIQKQGSNMNFVLLNGIDYNPIWSIPISEKIVNEIVISPDSKKFAFRDAEIFHEYSLQDGKEISTSNKLATDCVRYSVYRTCYSPDSKMLCFGLEILVKEAKFLKPAQTSFEMTSLESGNLSIARKLTNSNMFSFSPNGKCLAAINNGIVTIYTFPSLEPSMRLMAGGILHDMVWTNDSKSLLIIGNGAIMVDGQKTVHYPVNMISSISSIFSKKGGSFMVNYGIGGSSYFVRRWQINSDGPTPESTPKPIQ